MALLADRILLAVTAIQRIERREKLFAVRLGNVPRWIAHDRIKSILGLAKDVGEFNLPMKESPMAGQLANDRRCIGWQLSCMELVGQWAVCYLLGGPKPNGTPQIERKLGLLKRFALSKLMVLDGSLLGFMDSHSMDPSQRFFGIVMERLNLVEVFASAQVLLLVNEIDELVFHIPETAADLLGPCLFLEMDPIRMRLVPSLAHPGHRGIMHELVKPSPYQ